MALRPVGGAVRVSGGIHPPSPSTSKPPSKLEEKRSEDSEKVANVDAGAGQLVAASSTPSGGEYVGGGVGLKIGEFGVGTFLAAREEWLRKPANPYRSRIVDVDFDAIYDDLMGEEPVLCQRVPLKDMIEILIEIWEGEGLFDK